jgi:hypothetical protein
MSPRREEISAPYLKGTLSAPVVFCVRQSLQVYLFNACCKSKQKAELQQQSATRTRTHTLALCSHLSPSACRATAPPGPLMGDKREPPNCDSEHVPGTVLRGPLRVSAWLHTQPLWPEWMEALTGCSRWHRGSSKSLDRVC